MNRRAFMRLSGLAGTAVLFRTHANSLAATGKRPNIWLVMTDEQSADAMSYRMGDRFIKTPAIDDLAAHGTTFTRAYTANPLCVPARASIFTGQYPHVTGLQTNDFSKSIAGRFRCLGTYFKDAGYDTAYFGKWHLPYPEKDKPSHGFATMGANKNNGIDKDIPGFAKEFVQRKRDTPFLMVTSFVNPHNICQWARGEELPDGSVGEPPALDECPPAADNAGAMKDETDAMVVTRRSMQASPMFPVGSFDEKKWREYRWAYFRMIERVDGYIGEIRSALRAAGTDEETVIIFTSDHGDMQGAHGWNQKTVLYDNSSQVPLIIRHPEHPSSQRSDRLVNTGVDLLPTLLEFAGIPAASELPGIGLASSLRTPSAQDPRSYVVVQNKMVQGAPVDGQKPEPAGRMVRSKQFKYCVYDIGDRRESLVDMERDPGETMNLAGKKEYDAVLNQHRAYLAEWCRTTGDAFAIVPAQ